VDIAICLGKDGIQVAYMSNNLTLKAARSCPKRREVHNKLQLTRDLWTNKNDIVFSSDQEEKFPLLGNASSKKLLLKCYSISSSIWPSLHYTNFVFTYILYQQYLFSAPNSIDCTCRTKFRWRCSLYFDAVEPPNFLPTCIRCHI